jgi:hypothetical protein
MKQKTLITIHNLALILLGLASLHQYIDYKANDKFKKECDIIVDKMRNYNKENS